MNHHRMSERLRDLTPSTAEFRASVIDGLSMPRKTLPCKFFYDEEGSRLFEKICREPEYYLGRTECRLLEDKGAEIAALADSSTRVIEFGSGAGIKTHLLLKALRNPASYFPIDISREHLLDTASSLAQSFPQLSITPVCADYTKPFSLPPMSSGSRSNIGFFPGSSIGNFSPAEASAFLVRVRRLLGNESLMIVGVDLLKDEALFHAAYNDAAGVTAQFNFNLLHRINRELNGTFDIARFSHDAIWNPSYSRVEMHLVSRERQVAYVGKRPFSFEAGETIHTENSYKYGIEQFHQLALSAGYESLTTWCDKEDLFSIHILRAL